MNMTELKQYLLENGKEETKARLSKIDNGILLAELDDCIQFDLLKMDNVEYAKADKGALNLIIKEISERMKDHWDSQKQLLEALAENNRLRETIQLLKSQLLIYETNKHEEPKKNPRNAGRKKADDKWVASYDAFCRLYESHKSISEIMKECNISRSTYFRYKKLYEDTKILDN